MEASERGLVISPQRKTNVGLKFSKAGIKLNWEPDQQQIIMALLLWDKIALPQANIISKNFTIKINQPNDDLKILESENILVRPRVKIGGSEKPFSLASIAKAHIRAFQDLEAKSPGCWALAQGERPFLQRNGYLKEGRGFLVELYKAIPIPNKKNSC